MLFDSDIWVLIIYQLVIRMAMDLFVCFSLQQMQHTNCLFM